MERIIGEIRDIEDRARTESSSLLSREQITAAIDSIVDGTHGSVYEALTVGEFDHQKAEAIRRLLEDEEFKRLLDAGGITFGMVKPHPHMAHPLNHQRSEDDVTRAVLGEIRSPLELMVSAHAHIPLAQSAQFYAHLAQIRDGSIYKRVTESMSGGAVTGLILTDHDGNAIGEWRTQIGQTNPAQAAPDTLRGKFAVSIENNVVHGSDSIENARRELQAFAGWLVK